MILKFGNTSDIVDILVITAFNICETLIKIVTEFMYPH